jgi:hypothetical protein
MGGTTPTHRLVSKRQLLALGVKYAKAAQKMLTNEEHEICFLQKSLAEPPPRPHNISPLFV